MRDASSAASLARIIVGILLAALGICLITAFFQLPTPPLWVSAISMIVGLTILYPSAPIMQQLSGIGFFGTGVFIALRTLDIITDTWIQYGLGVFLFLLGVTILFYRAIGGMRTKRQDPL